MRFANPHSIAISAALLITGFAPAVRADLVSLAGSFVGTASVADPAMEDGDTDNTQTNPLSLAAADPAVFQFFSPEGMGDEQTLIRQIFSASATGLSDAGLINSADNASSFASFGSLISNFSFTVSEEAVYELTFTQNSDSNGSASTRFDASDEALALLELDGSNVSPFAQEFTLNPGVTYSITTSAQATAGGNSGSATAQSIVDYTLTLDIVPEPGVGLLVAVGGFVVMRRRMRSA